jgi:hypothetical protein
MRVGCCHLLPKLMQITQRHLYQKKEELLPDVFCYALETQTGTAAGERKSQQRLWGNENQCKRAVYYQACPRLS